MRTRAAPLCLALLTAVGAWAGVTRHAVFMFSLRGQPVGTVELSLSEAGLYRYTSRQLLQRAAHRHRVDRTEQAPEDGGAAPPWESLWLWQRPARPGCVTVRAELAHQTEAACVLRASAAEVSGTLAGVPFRARYRADPPDPLDALEELEVGEARFSRLEGPVPSQAPPPDLFEDGVPLHARAPPRAAGLEMAPPLPVAAGPAGMKPFGREAAQRLASEVYQSFPDKEPGEADFQDDPRATSASCAGHVRRFLGRARAQGAEAAAVFGVVAEGGRAYSHAWVRVQLPGGAWEDFDPTSLAPVTAGTHLAFEAHRDPAPSAQVGAVWLDLLAGRRRLLR